MQYSSNGSQTWTKPRTRKESLRCSSNSSRNYLNRREQSKVRG
ncbi:hypothetical protein MAR_010019 [Mya arenaria]|uniref:Uncharacterized protein n=1 Tax=Mya arenaria TaxID=6604 RepID=A0ABY7E8I3_MYAAR|nr:hypothetical protein MAR_010019 [Mya arenaria]